MKTSCLTSFLKIKGINGASGLIYKNNQLILIADDSFVLYSYSLKDNNLIKINLSENKNLSERMEKALKPDFEAVALKNNEFHVFGSGSAEKRFHHVIADAESLVVTERKSIKNLYNKMMETSGIKAEDFNIEGVILENNISYFFNRGNGPGKKNGIFKIDENDAIKFFPVKLPEIGGVVSGFTDACLFENEIYFTASAEASDSTYHDGEVLGSAIGKISLIDFSLKDFQIITDVYKIEGITVMSSGKNEIQFLLCEDADDDKDESLIFSLKIKK